MTDEAEVAQLPSLAEGLGADEIGMGQGSIVDDVGMTEHGSEAMGNAVMVEDMLVEAFGTLEMELVGGVGIFMPDVVPSTATFEVES